MSNNEPAKPSTAIQLAPSAEVRPHQETFAEARSMRYPTPAQWAQVTAMATVIADSGIGSEDIRGNVSKCMAIALKGFELGLGFMQSMDGIHVIKGRPELSADLKSALAQQRIPGCIVEWLADGMNGVATVRVTRAGRRDIVMSVTGEQVEKMGLDEDKTGGVKAIWDKHRPAMMRAYVLRSALRMQCPEVEYGFDAPEVVIAESQQLREYEVAEVVPPATETRAAVAPAVSAASAAKPAPVAPVAPVAKKAEPEVLEGEPQINYLDDVVLPFRTGEFANRKLSSLTPEENTRLTQNYRDRINQQPADEKNPARETWVARLTAWAASRDGAAK